MISWKCFIALCACFLQIQLEFIVDVEFILFFLQARDIHHSNVNPYLGVIVEPPKICIVSPYCTKGSLRVSNIFLQLLCRVIPVIVRRRPTGSKLARVSLQDILGNEDISLDWVFRVSFATDIAAVCLPLLTSRIIHTSLLFLLRFALRPNSSLTWFLLATKKLWERS